MPTTRDKRLFHLAELLAAELNKSRGDVQPEDIVSFMQCNVPMTEDELEEDFEESKREMRVRVTPGLSAIQRLRAALGFDAGDSLISVMEKAAEVCEESVRRMEILEEKIDYASHLMFDDN
jgi:hypothetical protein